MTIYFKKFAAIIALLGITGMSASFAADSTAIKPLPPNAKPVVQPYLLAQGKILGSTGRIDHATTTRQCPSNMRPYLSTSIIQTELNNIAAIQGIKNTLELRASDYHIVGDLYMSNQAVSNSYASADWQIWCQPTPTA